MYQIIGITPLCLYLSTALGQLQDGIIHKENRPFLGKKEKISCRHSFLLTDICPCDMILLLGRF